MPAWSMSAKQALLRSTKRGSDVCPTSESATSIHGVTKVRLRSAAGPTKVADNFRTHP